MSYTKSVSLNEAEKNYMARAEAERRAGSTVDINYRFPTVSVTLRTSFMRNEAEYFFQGEEAANLLNEVPDTLTAEDYILAMAQAW